MMKHNQNGEVSGLAMSLVLTIVILLGAIGFGVWAFNSRQDYKNHSDNKAQAAVKVAIDKEDITKNLEFAEISKNPLATYEGPQAYGSLIIKYPKTWSGYVDSSGSGNALVDGYFAPGVVPALSNISSVFALRVQVLNAQYSSVLQTFSNLVQAGKTTVSAYALPKVPSAIGVEVTGQINSAATQTMIVLPLRSQTIEISTQGTQYLNDFNKYILPNFVFSP